MLLRFPKINKRFFVYILYSPKYILYYILDFVFNTNYKYYMYNDFVTKKTDKSLFKYKKDYRMLDTNTPLIDFDPHNTKTKDIKCIFINTDKKFIFKNEIDFNNRVYAKKIDDDTFILSNRTKHTDYIENIIETNEDIFTSNKYIIAVVKGIKVTGYVETEALEFLFMKNNRKIFDYINSKSNMTKLYNTKFNSGYLINLPSDINMRCIIFKYMNKENHKHINNLSEIIAYNRDIIIDDFL